MGCLHYQIIETNTYQWVFDQRKWIVYSYLMSFWGIGKTTAPRCRGQLDVLLPKAECNSGDTEQRDSSFVYSAKQPLNNCFITQPKLKTPEFCQQLLA